MFVTPSASTTYRAVVITTQLSLATLEFVSSILWPLMSYYDIEHEPPLKYLEIIHEGMHMSTN